MTSGCRGVPVVYVLAFVVFCFVARPVGRGRFVGFYDLFYSFVYLAFYAIYSVLYVF